MRRRTAAGVLVTALLVGAPHAGAAVRKAATAPAVRQPVIAVIDTGIRATHQEFDYRGAASTSDQLVGWWDFTAEKKPKIALPQPGQAWDTALRDPYDPHGHGTGTAGMAAGRNVVPQKTPSAMPGAKLAIAKVFDKNGALSGSVAAAVTWAVDTIHADVISISIGTIVPVPALVQQADYNAISAARRKGVLVVVANGNGWGNVGVLPGDPAWANGYSSSPDVLSVGASGSAAYLVSTDPEVTASYSVVGPSFTADNAYVGHGGTSFSAPFVAGFAASLLRSAWEGGRALTPDGLERLVKYSAKDTSTPPSFEGYGALAPAELPAAQGHARAGTLPARPSPDLSGIYVEQVSGALRAAWHS